MHQGETTATSACSAETRKSYPTKRCVSRPLPKVRICRLQQIEKINAERYAQTLRLFFDSGLALQCLILLTSAKGTPWPANKTNAMMYLIVLRPMPASQRL